MRAQESVSIVKAVAGTYPFNVTGGRYRLAAIATWGGGNVQLSQYLPDGTTLLQLYGQPNTTTPTTWVDDLAANGILDFDLPPGQYALVFTTGTSLNATVTRIPIGE